MSHGTPTLHAIATSYFVSVEVIASGNNSYVPIAPIKIRLLIYSKVNVQVFSC